MTLDEMNKLTDELSRLRIKNSEKDTEKAFNNGIKTAIEFIRNYWDSCFCAPTGAINERHTIYRGTHDGRRMYMTENDNR